MDITWRTEKRKVKDLKPFRGNPRKATKKQKLDLEMSLERFNIADPLIINVDNTVIGGNLRLQLLKQMGVEEVDVRVPSRALTEEEAKELNLRLNKNVGEWDYDVLAEWNLDDLIDVGFGQEELNKIFKREEEAKRGEKKIEKMELRAFEKYDYIVMVFKDTYSWLNAVQYFGLRKVDLSFVKGRKKIGLGRVIDGAKLLKKLQEAGVVFNEKDEDKDEEV